MGSLIPPYLKKNFSPPCALFERADLFASGLLNRWSLLWFFSAWPYHNPPPRGRTLPSAEEEDLAQLIAFFERPLALLPTKEDGSSTYFVPVFRSFFRALKISPSGPERSSPPPFDVYASFSETSSNVRSKYLLLRPLGVYLLSALPKESSSKFFVSIFFLFPHLVCIAHIFL